MPSKERIDVLLVQQGHFPSREKAKAAIMAGLVYLGEERIDKAGTKVSTQATPTVKGSEHPYVGRGGLKMEKAIQYFGLDVTDQRVIDIGASTGGFTDCVLKHGASFVYAVDVGYNQLAWSLRSDSRVAVMERTNFRYIKRDDLPGELPELAMIDVSFISLRLILSPLKDVLVKGGSVIALIKPQFEAGRDQVGKAGIVRDPQVHQVVLQQVISFAATIGFALRGLTYSPVQGGEGNTEFLSWFTYEPAGIEEQLSEQPLSDDDDERIRFVVQEAHDHFNIR